MNQPKNLHIMNARPVPELATAIDNWLAARDQFKIEPTDEYHHEYDATYFDLSEAWLERYPDAAYTPEAFDWYRRGLIAPEEE